MLSLRAVVDVIFDIRVLDSYATPVEIAEDTVLRAQFQTTTTALPLPCECANIHRSRESEEDRASKKDHTKTEAARRASLVDEEARQMMVVS